MGDRALADSGLGGIRRRGARADKGRTKGEGGGIVTRISPLGFAVADDVGVSFELFSSGVVWVEVGFSDFSLGSDGVEVGWVEVEEAEVVLDVVGRSSKLNLELVLDGAGLIRTGEKVLRKST